jgi:hypothetical protein
MRYCISADFEKYVESHSQPVTKVLDEEVLRENPLRVISAFQKTLVYST